MRPIFKNHSQKQFFKLRMLEIYMLYSIPMYLQHESKPKRLRIVYLPPAIVVGFNNPDFQTLISPFFRWCFLKIITEWVRDHFLKNFITVASIKPRCLLPPCWAVGGTCSLITAEVRWWRTWSKCWTISWSENVWTCIQLTFSHLVHTFNLMS